MSIPSPTADDLERDAAEDYGGSAYELTMCWVRRAVSAEAALAAASQVIGDRGVCERDCTLPLAQRIDNLIFNERTADFWEAKATLAEREVSRLRGCAQATLDAIDWGKKEDDPVVALCVYAAVAAKREASQ